MDETFILEILHGEMQGFVPVGARHIREPFAVFIGGVFADATNVLHHVETERIGIDARIKAAVERWLVNDGAVRLEEFQHEAVGEFAFVVQFVEQGVVPERGPAFVHHLGLALRIEILRDLAYDSHYFALPGFQQRRILFNKVQQVFLRFFRVADVGFLFLLAQRFGNGAPEFVHLLLQIFFALFLALAFLSSGNWVGTLVAIDAVVHQRMTGIQHFFHFIHTVALFALHDVVLGEYQVIDDRTGVGPGAEQVVALEERVVAVTGVRNHQRLHHHGVFFHQIGDAGIGVDYDLVGKAHLAAAVVLFVRHKMLAVGPVVVTHRHAHR